MDRPQTKPLRVALVIRRYDHQGGGAERWTHEHALRLLDAGHTVHLVSSRFTGAPEGTIQHHVDAGPRWYRSAPWRFAAAAEAVVHGLDVDIVHDMGHGWSGDVLMPHHGTWRANFVARATGGRLRRLGRALAGWSFPRYRTLRELERRQHRAPELSRIAAVSRMVADDLHQSCGVPQGRTAVIHNGVDLVAFTPPASEHERERARERLGVGARPVALTIAQDYRRKGLACAVRALGRLAHDDRTSANPPLLLVVGKDDPRPLVHLARRLDCEHCLRFEGERQDVLAYYHAADVFVLPTLYDPCSLVVLEALACGLPVVTTAANGAAELFQHREQGVIVEDPRNAAALAEAIAWAAAPANRDRLRAAALKLRPMLDARRAFEAHVRLYREIAGVPASAEPPAAVTVTAGAAAPAPAAVAVARSPE